MVHNKTIDSLFLQGWLEKIRNAFDDPHLTEEKYGPLEKLYTPLCNEEMRMAKRENRISQNKRERTYPPVGRQLSLDGWLKDG